MRSDFLPFHRPSIGEEEIGAVCDALRSGWLTTGPRVQEFQSQFASYIGCKHAIAVNSATAALHLALEASGVRRGDEVLVPTMTFAATAEVACYLGAIPVLVDCEPDTLNISPEAMEKAVTPRTKAVIPVHYAGHPCDMGAILDIARSHNLSVIEDAAHALPAGIHNRRIGTWGDATCFSFYATKTITTGEGGMIATDSDSLADRIRVMSLHGISKDAWKRYTYEGSWYYEILHPGFKYNLTDIAAALGLAQLPKCTAFADRRRAIAEIYNDSLAHLAEFIRIPVRRAGIEHAWHLYTIRVRKGSLRIGRNGFITELHKRNVGTSVHFIPLHLHPFYRETFGYKPEDFPNSLSAYEEIVSLPIYPGMTDGDVRDVIAAIDDVCLNHRIP